MASLLVTQHWDSGSLGCWPSKGCGKERNGLRCWKTLGWCPCLPQRHSATPCWLQSLLNWECRKLTWGVTSLVSTSRKCLCVARSPTPASQQNVAAELCHEVAATALTLPPRVRHRSRAVRCSGQRLGWSSSPGLPIPRSRIGAHFSAEAQACGPGKELSVSGMQTRVPSSQMQPTFSLWQPELGP